MSGKMIRCTNERCRLGRGKGQMVRVDDRKDCRFGEDCAAWRAARGLDEPPAPLPYWRRPAFMFGGLAAFAVGGSLWFLKISGDDETILYPPTPITPTAQEDPSLLRSRAEGALLDLQAAAHRILRTHRALTVAEDATMGKDLEIAGITPTARTKEKTLERVQEAHEESRLFSAVFLKRREEIRNDNISYIDALVRMTTLPADLIDSLLENLSVRVSGVDDKEAALNLIRIHLDATRKSGKLDEERVFADFKNFVTVKP